MRGFWVIKGFLSAKALWRSWWFSHFWALFHLTSRSSRCHWGWFMIVFFCLLMKTLLMHTKDKINSAYVLSLTTMCASGSCVRSILSVDIIDLSKVWNWLGSIFFEELLLPILHSLLVITLILLFPMSQSQSSPGQTPWKSHTTAVQRHKFCFPT